MAKSPSKEKLRSGSSIPCKTPAELLRSQQFAEFLSLFNKVSHTYDLGIVIPQEVAEDPTVAESVYDYYKTPEGAMAANDEGRKKFGALAKKTISYVRESANRVIGAKGPKQKNERPPEWLTRVCPEFKGKLPAEAVRDMERIFQKKWLQNKEIFGEARQEMIMVSTIMNNFFASVLARDSSSILGESRPLDKKVVGSDDSKYGDRIKAMTWREFYAEIDEVMAEKGLSADKAREIVATMGGDWANFYLLPVFLELLRRGYKVYPDLSI
ncbi:hypothetical protein HZA44_02160 [Candidatus Peregrinibacteria bacterium]|nr:hypothetical protein [Candidatus Peregrinibacteria bacterium]